MLHFYYGIKKKNVAFSLDTKPGTLGYVQDSGHRYIMHDSDDGKCCTPSSSGIVFLSYNGLLMSYHCACQ